MTGVQQISVAADDADMRLDRWFSRHYPSLTHGRLAKLLRTGQVRVDGKRAKPGQRLAPGQMIRVPPLELPAGPIKSPPRPVSKDDADALQARILYRDEEVLVLDKPAGLAVQGGSGTTRHLDGMLDCLRFDAAERPRLVHRLDRDTSGVLVLARSRSAARWLAEAFRQRSTRKLYWGGVLGVPAPNTGRIEGTLAKRAGPGGERMMAGAEDGQNAVTLYRTIEHASDKASWLALEPRTGRTHQLRVHCAELGTPIIGDGKYGGAGLSGLDPRPTLHLHARAIWIDRPDGKVLAVRAPLPDHMIKSWQFLGFNLNDPTADMWLE